MLNYRDAILNANSKVLSVVILTSPGPTTCQLEDPSPENVLKGLQ